MLIADVCGRWDECPSDETPSLQLTEDVLFYLPVCNAHCRTLSRAPEMAADDKRSPTLDSASDLPRSPSSPSHLTHFKPLTPDQDEPPFKSAYSSFVNLFRFSKGKFLGDHVCGWCVLSVLLMPSAAT